MKKFSSYLLKLLIVCALLSLTACLSDKHNTAIYPQKILGAVSTKYPNEQNTLVFIEAPEGLIAPHQAVWEVEKHVDSGNVAAIINALALKTNTLIVAGENESLTAATLSGALTQGKDKIGGSKAVVVGAKETQKSLADLASASGVTLEFIDNPN